MHALQNGVAFHPEYIVYLYELQGANMIRVYRIHHDFVVIEFAVEQQLASDNCGYVFNKIHLVVIELGTKISYVTHLLLATLVSSSDACPLGRLLVPRLRGLFFPTHAEYTTVHKTLL